MTAPQHNTDDDLFVRPFSDWLREQSGGRTHEELSDALHDLVQRVRDTGKKGQLIYTVQVSPFDNGGALVVADQIKLKLPEHDRNSSIFYADDNGNLAREDPRQLKFDSLREVPTHTVDKTTGEAREVN